MPEKRFRQVIAEISDRQNAAPKAQKLDRHIRIRKSDANVKNPSRSQK